MNLLPERGLLAVAAVVDVALNARSAPVAAKALAARHGLKPRHLEALLQDLVRANILRGTRGPRGGYELARERRRITAAEILRVAARDGQAARSRPRSVKAVVVPALRRAGDAYLAELDLVTVDDLCALAETAGTVLSADADFTI